MPLLESPLCVGWNGIDLELVGSAYLPLFKEVRKGRMFNSIEPSESLIVGRVCPGLRVNPAIVQRLGLGRNAPSASREKPNTVSDALRPEV